MEELKACDITLLEKRLKNLSAGLENMGNGDIMVNRAMLTACRDYMAELLALRRAAPENKPLTMEELRRMDGEPVFAIPLDKNADWIEHWAILRKDIVTANSISTKGRMYFLYLKDYGKTWLAYARKPEGDETP